MASLPPPFPIFRSAVVTSVTLLGFLAPALASDPALPSGVGYSVSIPSPSVKYPLPVAENYRNQTGKNAQGEAFDAYSDQTNPVINILSGFNHIWSLGDDAWAHGGANGDGPKDFSKARVVDPDIWAENMRYVLSVTGKNRTDAAALNAYLNDRRSQSYSVIEGLGPLAGWYRDGAGATTTINHTLGDFDVNDVITRREDDKGTEAGSPDSQLRNFVAFMAVMRGPEGTTSPSKYFYSSPRPWRMNAKGEVIETGTETIGDRTFERYETEPDVTVPALRYARENRGRAKDGGFPSGHTNAGYLAAIAYAYAVPERFSELLTKASQLGESRIVAGMHSPLDVMGGRITATAIAAAVLQDPKVAGLKKAAHDEVHAYFEKMLPEGQGLHDFAHSETVATDRFADEIENKANFRKRMTYSFSRDPAMPDVAMIVPEGAEVLLETRLPYLDAAQRRAVLFSTGIESGYPLLDDSNGWGRLNLVAAAAGYGSFDGDVSVDMDASAGGFHARDRWSNDISGQGGLIKSGSGSLELSGANSYSGGTELRGGTLIAASPKALGSRSVRVSDGTLQLAASDAVTISGNYVQTSGKLSLDPAKTALHVAGSADVGNTVLEIDFAGTPPAAGTRFDVLSANLINGTFASIDSKGVRMHAVYTGNTVSVIVE